MSAEGTRTTIIVTADELFYRQGFEATSFADIAEAVKLSRGNFYYHFKTKDDILAAVIDHRLDRTRAMLAAWDDEEASPQGRIGAFIRILLMNRAKIRLHGCPVGTLCNELTRLNHPSQAAAAGLFMLFRAWLNRQFTALGLDDAADDLSTHLLARSQGIAVLYNALGDDDFLHREVENLEQWLAQAIVPAP